MYRLTVNGVTYTFTSAPDFELARNIARRLEPPREQFERELQKRWIKWIHEGETA